MSRRTFVYCDRGDCNTHAVETLTEDAGFMSVDWSGRALDFCSTDCAMLFFSGFPPMVVK